MPTTCIARLHLRRSAAFGQSLCQVCVLLDKGIPRMFTFFILDQTGK
ncbi:unnamed protein product [Amoebophrya sp. A25]|nr:unnamed protein product [Amoebophrya sp. A25]|eukprot:GSA25T00001941001.1